ncbi:hypothetical protein LN047_05910 [Achromobacter sp. JD417]|uniref:hypothetical protein n=1 Tax=Achromobacter sp. JD417 TaxID=2893881 RepID=UPI0035A6D4E7
MSDVSRPIGLHHKTAQAIQDETLAAIHRWFDTLQARDDIDAIVARTRRGCCGCWRSRRHGKGASAQGG